MSQHQLFIGLNPFGRLFRVPGLNPACFLCFFWYPFFCFACWVLHCFNFLFIFWISLSLKLAFFFYVLRLGPFFFEHEQFAVGYPLKLITFTVNFGPLRPLILTPSVSIELPVRRETCLSLHQRWAETMDMLSWLCSKMSPCYEVQLISTINIVDRVAERRCCVCVWGGGGQIKSSVTS